MKKSTNKNIKELILCSICFLWIFFLNTFIADVKSISTKAKVGGTEKCSSFRLVIYTLTLYFFLKKILKSK